MNEPSETPRRRLTGAVVPALAAAGVAAVGAILLVGVNGRSGQATAAPQNCIIEGADAVGGPIDLLDANGGRVTQADFAGDPAVVYFGFTHCPDVCPTSMYAVGEALAQPGGYDVQPILISVDPERDTPELMGAYAQTLGFPSGLVGLTGSVAQVEAAKQSFDVYASRRPIEGATDGSYNVDHSSFLYVLDGQWRTVAIIPTIARERPNDPSSPLIAAPIEDISACIAAGLERAEPS